MTQQLPVYQMQRQHQMRLRQPFYQASDLYAIQNTNKPCPSLDRVFLRLLFSTTSDDSTSSM